MLHQKIDLPGSTVLARIFFRSQQANRTTFSELEPGDFERRFNRKGGSWRESGISLFRLDLVSQEEALAIVLAKSKSNKLSGVASLSAKALQDLGYQFIGSRENPVHISLRCTVCSLDLIAGADFCQAQSGFCLFDRANSLPFLEELVNLFTVTKSA